MSHIHLPDGVVPVAWWVGGFVLTFAIISLILKSIDKDDARRKIPFTGVAAAIMLVGMLVPLVIVPVHLSLAVMTGILIGPKLGFLAVFVVNVILASFGHGGITLVGINTLIIGSEVAIGAFLFRGLRSRAGLFPSVMVTTVVALLVSMALMVSLVGITADVAAVLPNHHHGEHHHEHETHETHGTPNHQEHDHSRLSEEVAAIRYFAFTGWTAVLMILFGGIALESLGTAFILRFFAKIRPDLIPES